MWLLVWKQNVKTTTPTHKTQKVYNLRGDRGAKSQMKPHLFFYFAFTYFFTYFSPSFTHFTHMKPSNQNVETYWKWAKIAAIIPNIFTKGTSQYLPFQVFFFFLQSEWDGDFEGYIWGGCGSRGRPGRPLIRKLVARLVGHEPHVQRLCSRRSSPWFDPDHLTSVIPPPHVIPPLSHPVSCHLSKLSCQIKLIKRPKKL